MGMGMSGKKMGEQRWQDRTLLILISKFIDMCFFFLHSTFSIEDMGRSLGGSTALATASTTMVAPSLLLAVVRAAALRLP